MSTEFDYYKIKERNRKIAEGWLNLLNSRDSQDGKYFITSPCHGSIKLMICGQHHAGGKNYHESDAEFNRAMMLVISRRIKELGAEAISILKKEEAEALVSCKDFLDKINAEVKEAESELLNATV